MKEANDATIGAFIQEARFTLLETCLYHETKAHILERETYWKNALGTRVHGLNAN